MKKFILAAGIGMLLATLAPERGVTATVPQTSLGTSSLIVQVQVFDRCARLLRRCNRGNANACRLYQVECRGVEPIY